MSTDSIHQRVNDLIDNPRTIWTELDRQDLEQLPESILIRLEQQPLEAPYKALFRSDGSPVITKSFRSSKGGPITQPGLQMLSSGQCWGRGYYPQSYYDIAAYNCDENLPERVRFNQFFWPSCDYLAPLRIFADFHELMWWNRCAYEDWRLTAFPYLIYAYSRLRPIYRSNSLYRLPPTVPHFLWLGFFSSLCQAIALFIKSEPQHAVIPGCRPVLAVRRQ